jgi:hypothetical protein
VYQEEQAPQPEIVFRDSASLTDLLLFRFNARKGYAFLKNFSMHTVSSVPNANGTVCADRPTEI